ncbi:hypothetical protein HYW74_04065 [Candidatus Pacearchaeota archaeon]|nr:hypothetical protein [Candidatus Pacearchaeota archaeon]
MQRFDGIIRYYAEQTKFAGIIYHLQFKDDTLRDTRNAPDLPGFKILLDDMRKFAQSRINGFTVELNGSENGDYRPLTEEELVEIG